MYIHPLRITCMHHLFTMNIEIFYKWANLYRHKEVPKTLIKEEIKQVIHAAIMIHVVLFMVYCNECLPQKVEYG